MVQSRFLRASSQTETPQFVRSGLLLYLRPAWFYLNNLLWDWDSIYEISTVRTLTREYSEVFPGEGDEALT